MSYFEVNSFQVPNSVIDELMATMSGNELKCYLVIVRKTKGWQKESDAISLTQFEKLTNLSRSVIVKSCQSLIEMGLVECKKGARNSNVYRLRKCTSSESELVQKLNRKGSENELVTSSETEHTKDNIKYTTINTNNIYKGDFDLSELKQKPSVKVWDDFLIHRKNKKAILTQSAVDSLIKQFNILIDKGYEIDSILSDIMANGWRGFSASWILKNNDNPKTTTKKTKQPASLENKNYGDSVIPDWARS